MSGQVGALGGEMAQQSVGVLIRPALPRTVRVTEVDLEAGVDPELGVLGHLRTLVPGQRATKLLGQRGDHAGDLVADRFSAVAGERWTILHALPVAVAFHA